eukprot:CAMPEP_0184415940 /NCGR_PEP_ID=MMETSP0738-20130409/9108_1 /TAXON_ID=385413 /ORGANISM="Thalassiosira miniscula, Strain CCMP1093" /LENGTH=60 /DNA_ID=CAMNT_0026775263 /DNA_START=390 /DNA_END=572 /DNA_ORIENTATION=+
MTGNSIVVTPNETDCSIPADSNRASDSNSDSSDSDSTSSLDIPSPSIDAELSSGDETTPS